MKVFKLEKNSGFSILEVLISVGLSTIVALIVLTSVGIGKKPLTQAKMEATSLTLRNSVMRILAKPGSWSATIRNNVAAKFSCPKASTGPCAAVASFNLYDESGAIFFNAGNAAKGFKHDGTGCNANSGTAPTSDCPIRITPSWTSVRTDASPSQILVNVTFDVWNPSTKTVVRKENLAINIYKTVTSIPCYLKSGASAPDGGSVTAWQYGTGSCTAGVNSESRACSNGVFTNGTFEYSTCAAATCPAGLTKRVNGCWVLAATNKSCSGIGGEGCGSFGGPDESYMNTYGGGPTGTDAQCGALLDAITTDTGTPTGAGSATAVPTDVDGCYITNAGPARFRSELSTVGSHAPGAGKRRACACYF